VVVRVIALGGLEYEKKLLCVCVCVYVCTCVVCPSFEKMDGWIGCALTHKINSDVSIKIPLRRHSLRKSVQKIHIKQTTHQILIRYYYYSTFPSNN